MTPFLTDLDRLTSITAAVTEGAPVSLVELRDAVAAVHRHLSGGERAEPAPYVLADDPRLREAVLTVYGPARWREYGDAFRLYVDGQTGFDHIAFASQVGHWSAYPGPDGEACGDRDGTSDDPITAALAGLRELGTIADPALPPCPEGDGWVLNTGEEPADLPAYIDLQFRNGHVKPCWCVLANLRWSLDWIADDIIRWRPTP